MIGLGDEALEPSPRSEFKEPGGGVDENGTSKEDGEGGQWLLCVVVCSGDGLYVGADRMCGDIFCMLHTYDGVTRSRTVRFLYLEGVAPHSTKACSETSRSTPAPRHTAANQGAVGFRLNIFVIRIVVVRLCNFHRGSRHVSYGSYAPWLVFPMPKQ
jgi:hypothetical protein